LGKIVLSPARTRAAPSFSSRPSRPGPSR